MKVYLSILLLCYTGWLGAQIKFDYNWILGKPSSIEGDTTGVTNGTIVDFENGFPTYTYFNIHFDLDANSAISDSLGKLLFYSNGCAIINCKHQEMKNGSAINEGGWAYESNCLDTNYPSGYPTHQGLMIFPWPNRPNMYIIPHLHRSENGFHIQQLRYSVVDMTGDNGLGEVVEKNTGVFQDTLLDMMTAVRHANGRDWWLVAPKFNYPRIYVFLVSPEGISQPLVQDIGVAFDNRSWGMQATFSPNGKKYFNMYGGVGLQIFDFDRCNGELSNAQLVKFPGDTIHACGVAVSPKSRYLYTSTGNKLYQFDLKANDLVKSRRLVGVYDGFKDPTYTNFYQLMAAPDGKLYMTCGNGARYWHIIHYPDKRGLGSNLEQHFQLPASHSFSPPNFPHFRLFDLPGSVCDSLGIDGPLPPEDTLASPGPPPCYGALRALPNPAAYATLLEVPWCAEGGLNLYDASGRWVRDETLAGGPVGSGTPLDVSELAPGIYFLRVQLAGGEIRTMRLAVVR